MAGFLQEWLLTLLVMVPIAGAAAVGLSSSRGDAEPAASRMRRSALGFSVATFGLTLMAVVLFLQATDSGGNLIAPRGGYALVQNLAWVTDAEAAADTTPGGYVDFRYHVGVDGLSIWLIVLTAGMTPLAIWASFSRIRHRVKEYYLLMLLLEAGTIGAFCARDLLLFYIFTEFTLIPLFFIVGIWGGKQRRRAAVQCFIYSAAGSALTLTGVLFLAYQAYALPASQNGVGVFTFDLDTLYALKLGPDVQWWLFLAFAAGFAVRTPLFPFHTWLPPAHTEAPAPASALLAGVLLKLGAYGFLRVSLPMLPAAATAFAPIVAAFAIAGILYAALVAWAQDDFKKLIAYASVSHLGFCILGMFSLKTAGLTGSVVYMINHGLSTGALFLIVGMIHERYHTRRFDQLGGLARPMPVMAAFLILFTLSSIGLPGLNGFVGEFLVLLGTFTSAADAPHSPAGPLGIGHAALAATGIVLSAIYMLSMCRCLLGGPVRKPASTPDGSHGLTPDLTPREIGALAPVAAICLLLGLWPNAVIDTIQPAAREHVLTHVFPHMENRTLSPPQIDLGDEPTRPLGRLQLRNTRISQTPPAGRSSQRVCEKGRHYPSRDREGAVFVGLEQPLPHGRGSETAFHVRSQKWHDPLARSPAPTPPQEVTR